MRPGITKSLQRAAILWPLANLAPLLLAANIETDFFHFAIQPSSGRWELKDNSGLLWNDGSGGLGEAVIRENGELRQAKLGACQTRSSGQTLELTFSPFGTAEKFLRVRLRAVEGGQTLEVSIEPAPALRLERFQFGSLETTGDDGGYLAVPVREGILIPADSGKTFHHFFDTFAYEGFHMEMLGLVRKGRALLVTWHDPYFAAEITSSLRPEGQRLDASLVLPKSASSFRLRFLGPGDFVTLAKAYRAVALEKGWRVSWPEKLAGNPERAKLFGAVDFKLWSALDRRMNEASTLEERVQVNWTFSEAAQIAEHLKGDLELNKVLFIVGGWIHRGYDNQHPDILPAAPECGGNQALADCARRVQDLGYLFCLHDNYQDIYRDSPSWDERLIMKNGQGKLVAGGHWAGGRAYLTCSKEAVALANRPQNLPAVKQLTGAKAYFIDTTYAAGLQECFDPNHPLTRWDDMKWKQQLSDDARRLFGIFGSECGREWAIPHSDFFEGLGGVSGRSFHDPNLLGKLGGIVVPLFEIAYHDDIAVYGKYGYDPAQSGPYVLHTLRLGRTLNYHSIPAHLYWRSARREISNGPDAAFVRADNGWAEGLHPLDRFIKNTYEILSPLNELTAQLPMEQYRFLTADRQVQQAVFGQGAEAVEVIVNFGPAPFHAVDPAGGFELPRLGFLVRAPTFLAFHASAFHGLRYEKPVLFTLRSLDGRPLDRSKQVRIFHGFGEARLAWGGSIQTVKREETIEDEDSKSR